MTERLLDIFVQPTLYERFNLKRNTGLPAGLKLSDFTIVSTTIKERELMPLPKREQTTPGIIQFQTEEVVIFDERPKGTLIEIDDNGDRSIYRNAAGVWITDDHLHVEVNNLVPGFFWLGAQWTPTISVIVEQSTTGWWWIFTLRDSEKEYPGDFIQGGYVFEKEEDAICVRAALDVK